MATVNQEREILESDSEDEFSEILKAVEKDEENEAAKKTKTKIEAFSVLETKTVYRICGISDKFEGKFGPTRVLEVLHIAGGYAHIRVYMPHGMNATYIKKNYAGPKGLFLVPLEPIRKDGKIIKYKWGIKAHSKDQEPLENFIDEDQKEISASDIGTDYDTEASDKPEPKTQQKRKIKAPEPKDDDTEVEEEKTKQAPKRKAPTKKKAPKKQEEPSPQ